MASLRPGLAPITQLTYGYVPLTVTHYTALQDDFPRPRLKGNC